MSSKGNDSMNNDANWTKELPKEDKATEDGVLGAGKSLSKDNDMDIDAINEDGMDVVPSGLQGQGILQVQQQLKPPGTKLCWERLIHAKSIRVLLVETDESTRNVVTALLRKCNYEVLEAASGLQAWKILEDLNNHIDLVLAEVAMPCLSGIGLLCKITNHNIRRCIPVIMMSSHDSVSLVFKCLSKGAVDFLVKPIRKNELKNLWQHVWRRCHSSSGSGSESRTRPAKYMKSKNSAKLDNSGSDHGENNGTCDLNVGDESDDGSESSDAQSSWIKQSVEVGSLKAMSPMDQLAECRDSMHMQLICSNAETAGNKMVKMSVSREGHIEKQPEVILKCKNSETVVPRIQESQSENLIEVSLKLEGGKHKSLLEIDCNTNNKRVNKGQFNLTDEFSANTLSPCIGSRVSESTREVANILYIDNNMIGYKELNLEHCSQKFRGVQSAERTVQDNPLRHPEQSVFSRYSTSSNVFRIRNGVPGGCSIVNYSVELANRGSICDIQARSFDHPLYQSSKGISNNIDMGCTTNKLCTLPSIMKAKYEATSTTNSSSAFKPVNNDLRSTQQQVTLAMPSDMQATADLTLATGSHQEGRIHHHNHNNHHHHHHHHCHCHHFHNLAEQPPSNHNKLSPKKLTAYASCGGTANAFGGSVDANPVNYSVNKSASGRNHGSNGKSGRNSALNAFETNAKSDIGRAGKTESGNVSDNVGGNRGDKIKLAQQKASLKRKER